MGTQLFTEPLLFDSGVNSIAGGSTGQFQTVAMYLVQQAFTGQRFGYASTVAWVLFLLIAAFSPSTCCCCAGSDRPSEDIVTQTQLPVVPAATVVVPRPGGDPSPKVSGRRTRSLRRAAWQSTGATPATPLVYLTLAVSVLLAAGPLYYMVVMASRPNSDITSIPPPLTPGDQLGENISRVFANQDVAFAQAMINSVLVAGLATVSVVVLSALAGFAFAKLPFKGRNALLLIVIGTMMVPVQLGLVPLYMLMGKLGLAGTLPSALLPFLVSGFGVFMMRQYAAQAIPNELIEVAAWMVC